MADTSEAGKNLIVKLVLWIIERLERTIFLSVKITLPKRYLSPLGFSGMLTFVTFVILGLTGAILMLYYIPTFEGAYDSVKEIEEQIPYGFLMRNIHYHASNAMVFLAVIHLYYQFFSGRYKIRNEIIWVTGVIMGLFVVLEAFTGYDLIYNDRAVLALSIGAGLANASPIIGVAVREALFGSGFSDFVIRFYAYHVFIVPLLLGILMLVHFPKNVILDLPMAIAATGAIMMVGGAFPVPLGVKFDPNVPPTITVPEWYLTGLYAFIRTGYEKFFTGGLIPLIFVMMFLVIPFVDKGRKFTWKDRPLYTALGIASIGQIIITTYWGFYVSPDINLETFDRLFIQPVPFYGVMLGTFLFGFVLSYLFIHIIKKHDEKVRATRRTPVRPKQLALPQRWIMIVMGALVILQVALNFLAIQAYAQGFVNLALFEIGAIMLGFAFMVHVYRYGLGKVSVPVTTLPARPQTEA